MAVVYDPAEKWLRSNLTWRFSNSVGDGKGITQAQAEELFQKACDLWAAPSGLTFVQSSADPVDILVIWEPLDGAGEVLAHSTNPDGRNTQVTMKFDTADDWTANKVYLTAVSFFTVALHELGHAIGLDHSASTQAVMYPMNSDFLTPAHSELSTDDEDGAKYLYNQPRPEVMEIMIVNESDRSFSWFAFHADDVSKVTAVASNNLFAHEIYRFQPTEKRNYFIRFTDVGGGTEYAGAIVDLVDHENRVMAALQQIGSAGFAVEIS